MVVDCPVFMGVISAGTLAGLYTRRLLAILVRILLLPHTEWLMEAKCRGRWISEIGSPHFFYIIFEINSQ